MRESSTEEEGRTACQEDEEQEQDERVLLVKEVVGQSCKTNVHTTAGIACVDSSEAIRDVYAQKPVTEANGCFAESRKSTEEGYEGEKRDDDHQDDGAAEGNHDKLQFGLILSASEKLPGLDPGATTGKGRLARHTTKNGNLRLSRAVASSRESQRVRDHILSSLTSARVLSR